MGWRPPTDRAHGPLAARTVHTERTGFKELRVEHNFSFYDSLIIASATQANCQVLYSEDMQHMQRIGSLQIVNPFLMLANEATALQAG